MKAILTQSSALTTRYLKIGGNLMKASPISNRPVNTYGNSMKKLTALSLLTLLVTLLALGGAPRAWGQAACTNCTTSQVGNRAVYKFTGNGSFTPSQNLTADILVVGGGGGGGGNTSTGAAGYYDVGGGGGAGGFLAPTSVSLTGGSVYAVTVGAGGTAGTPSAKGGNGTASSIIGTGVNYTATGGGGGGSGSGPSGDLTDGLTGGSGGGGGVDDWDGYIGAVGTTNGQGHNGAAGTVPYYELGGGGGGAGAAGSAQNGGNGSASGITGTSVTYAGGGGGGGGGYSAGTGGTGGGGAGGKNSAGAAGTANTGGGGGGGSSGSGSGTYNGGAGGSGIVIVSYVFSPTAVKVNSFSAIPSEGGNLIKLQTGREVNNLGFNIYREQDGQRVKLNSSLLAGSALMGGAGTTFTAGHTRTWQDDLPGGSGSVAYWVEEIDLRGASTWYGPVSPDSTPPSTSAGMRSAAMRTAVTGAALRGGVPSSAPAVSLSSIGRSATTSTAAVTVAAAATATPQNLQTQWALAAGKAVKLGVRSEGWYRVTQPQLVAAGLSPNINPSRLQLYVNGVQQPILVEGQSDRKFGSQDAIDFYGMGVDTIWSDTQEYWLVVGNGPGLRISSQNKSNGSAGASSFPFSVQWKPRTVYFAALLNGDGNNFFGPVTMLDSADPVTQPLPVTNLSAGTPGNSTLQVRMQGVTAGAHAVTVTLNGNFVGNMAFSDQNSSTSSFLVRNSYLHEGANTLGLTVTGGASDVSLVDTVLLTYPHSYIANSNSLRMTAASGQKVTVSGFSGSSVQVIDITNPSSVSLVPGTVSAGKVAFVPQGGGTRTLLAVASSQFASPASITGNQGSSWHSAQAGADMVIISHGDFIDSLAQLVALRQSQGLKVVVVDVEDLYDEFNFGVESPYAIRSFLLAAKANWSTKPAYVLLMGNGTFDPRNYLGTTVPDLVPAKLVDTNLIETASDDWFADFNNDGIPEMVIGRLPARTEDQAVAMVNKIVAYEQARAGGWKDKVLLVAGQNDAENDFEAYTTALLALLPGGLPVTQIFQGSDSLAHSDLENSINLGVGLVNYIGHGSNEIWAGGLLSSTDTLDLINGLKAPVVIAMTCLNGYFQDVYTNSLAGALMNAPGGGAVAVWASSGLTESGPQAAMDQALIRVLYGSQPVTLGEAAASAKEAVSDQDVRKTWILFGDPAMKVR